MKKTMCIRLIVFISEISILILLWYILTEIIYIYDFGFLCIYILMPLFLLLFLFSCIKTIIIFIHLFRKSTNRNNNISWRESLPKVAKSGIALSLLAVFIFYGIHLSKFNFNIFIPSEQNIGVSTFTNKKIDDGMIHCIQHGETTIVSKQYYSLQNICPEADFDCSFSFFLLYNVPRPVLDAYYTDRLSSHPTNSEFICIKDAYGLKEINYIVEDKFFVCVVKDNDSVGFVLLSGFPKSDFVICDNALNLILELFKEGKNTYTQN